jgi:hypothetical protein
VRFGFLVRIYETAAGGGPMTERRAVPDDVRGPEIRELLLDVLTAETSEAAAVRLTSST